nr:MAG TPA: hypothetical protein [Bacteriophage sp.]
MHSRSRSRGLASARSDGLAAHRCGHPASSRGIA